MTPKCLSLEHDYKHFTLETMKIPSLLPKRDYSTTLIISAILYCTKCGDVINVEPRNFIKLNKKK